MHGDAAGFEVHVFPRAGKRIGAFPIKRNGGIRRGHLVLRPNKSLQRLRRIRAIGKLNRHRGRLHDLAFRVIGIGGCAKAYARNIALVIQRKKAQKARCLPYAHNEDARSGRVKRSCMAYAPLRERAANAAHDIMARHATGLGDRDYESKSALAPLHS